jgi:hypothetical protein
MHDLPKGKAKMNYKPNFFWFNGIGIFLCAILDYLIDIQNNFLEKVMLIPPGTCKSQVFK